MDTPARIDINEIGGPKPYYASERNRYEDGTRIQAQSHRVIYEQFVKPRIAEGNNPVLFPMEFVLYVAEKSHVSETYLSQLMGISNSYISAHLNSGANSGSHALPKPIQYKMAALTGTDPVFWTSRYFNANQADQVRVVNKDITQTNAMFMPNGHLRAEARNTGWGK